jgi:CBS domain-containing protein
MTIDLPVSTIMSRHVAHVSMDDPLRRVRELFEQRRFHHLIVTETGRVVGILSDRDLLTHLSPFLGKVSEREQDAHTLDRRVHQIMSRRLVSCSPHTPAAEERSRPVRGDRHAARCRRLGVDRVRRARRLDAPEAGGVGGPLRLT